MKVLHVGKFYPPVRGGVETYVRDVCEGLAKRVDVTCVVSGNGSVEIVNGVRVVRLSKLPFRHPVSPSLLSFLKNNKFDVVHLHMPNPWAEFCCLLSKPKRLVVTYHADVVKKFGSSIVLPIQRKVLRMAEKIVVFSKEYADSSPILRDFKDKIAIIPYGVDVNKFKKFDKSRVKELRSLGKSPFFLFVGRLVRYKGLRFLIKAMREVDGTLFIVGNGSLLANLRSIANDRVHFFTKVSDEDLVNFYHACDVFVLPSTTRAEAFGIVQLEAMACGKPVISTRLNTGVDFVNKSGILVPPADVNSLVNAMNSFQNKSLCSKVGKAGLERVKAHFSRAQMITSLLDLYSS